MLCKFKSLLVNNSRESLSNSSSPFSTKDMSELIGDAGRCGLQIVISQLSPGFENIDSIHSIYIEYI